MTKKTRNLVDDLRGASRLAVEATAGVTDLVAAMHYTIAGGPALLGRPLGGLTRLLTAPAYESVRAVTRLVGAGIDVALGRLAPVLGESAPGPENEAVIAVLNGVLGDYLIETGNPLAIQMSLRYRGLPLPLERTGLQAALPHASGKLLILLHGSSMGFSQWNRNGHDHGAALARDLGYTPIYLHYNSGLHVSTNGHAFAALLERLVAAYPVPIEELAIIAHSMGGLVSRSACHSGEVASHAWRRALRKLVFLGTPHHGAALERGGNWVHLLLGISRYSAPFARLARIRSAGVTDLRFGNLLDEDWHGRDRFAHGGDTRRLLPLPDGVACYAIAATSAHEAVTNLPGDGLVTVASALGRHRDTERTLAFPEAHQWIGFGMSHLDLLHRPEVYSKLKSWLGSCS